MTKIPEDWQKTDSSPFDFIVVGSGAGGGPLAARLAERGFAVLVVEMGPEKPKTPSSAAVENTTVPLLHGETTEDSRHSLRYFVKHFDHDPEGSLDHKIHVPSNPSKENEDDHGIFYPRAQGIGGCTIHNAMITVCGPSEDWDEIAEATGDDSWRGHEMRTYFERIDRCHFARPATLFGKFRAWLGLCTGWEYEAARHGTHGWLDSTVADLRLLLNDKRLFKVVSRAVLTSLSTGVERVGELVRAAFRAGTFPALDPNHWENMHKSLEGLIQIPCAIDDFGERSSPRERLLQVARKSTWQQARPPGGSEPDPAIGEDWLFTVDDFPDPRAFALRLVRQTDPVAKYLLRRLSGKTRHSLMDIFKNSDNEDENQEKEEALWPSLVDELNAILKGRSIYHKRRFAHVRLTHETRESLCQVAGSRSFVRLNRFLIEDAFPRELGHLPGRLEILAGVCVTEVLFKESEEKEPNGESKTTRRAIGIRCLPKEHVYEADPNVEKVDGDWKPKTEKIHCNKEGEIILCAGSFNTPQLLMLSGVGPQKHLKAKGIECHTPLAGVGRNLQDRYEVPVVAKITGRFSSLDKVALTSNKKALEPDPQMKLWRNMTLTPGSKRGLYATNGGLIGILKRSQFEDSIPDLFIFALAATFEGYEVGWSKPSKLAPSDNPKKMTNAAAEYKRTLTWLILKGRTRSNEGWVELRDNTPFRRPDINFASFPKAKDDNDLVNCKDNDLHAIVEGVDFVQQILEAGKQHGEIQSYELPALKVTSNSALKWRVPIGSPSRNDLYKAVKHLAWGHHACGTCRIGRKEDSKAVLDSRFRVHNIEGLRVVDASVFPRIPGYFIVTNIYMVSEKAADVITEDHSPREDSDAEQKDSSKSHRQRWLAKILEVDPVILSSEDSRKRQPYPKELEHAEAELIAERRRKAQQNKESNP